MPIKQAPFDHEGNLMHHTEYRPGENTDRIDWRDNAPFSTTLQLTGASRGRSSAYFVWADERGARYPMFVTDIVQLMQRHGVRKGGKVTARWHVVKRGNNHGVALAPDD